MRQILGVHVSPSSAARLHLIWGLTRLLLRLRFQAASLVSLLLFLVISVQRIYL